MGVLKELILRIQAEARAEQVTPTKSHSSGTLFTVPWEMCADFLTFQQCRPAANGVKVEFWLTGCLAESVTCLLARNASFDPVVKSVLFR